jgi:hypothetical protein
MAAQRMSIVFLILSGLPDREVDYPDLGCSGSRETEKLLDSMPSRSAAIVQAQVDRMIIKNTLKKSAFFPRYVGPLTELFQRFTCGIESRMIVRRLSSLH